MGTSASQILAAAHLVVDVAGWFPNGTDFTHGDA